MSGLGNIFGSLGDSLGGLFGSSSNSLSSSLSSTVSNTNIGNTIGSSFGKDVIPATSSVIDIPGVPNSGIPASNGLGSSLQLANTQTGIGGGLGVQGKTPVTPKTDTSSWSLKSFTGEKGLGGTLTDVLTVGNAMYTDSQNRKARKFELENNAIMEQNKRERAKKLGYSMNPGGDNTLSGSDLDTTL